MPVTLSIVESTTELNTVVTEVILESASTPGPPGVGVPAGGTTGQALVKASDTDYDTEWDDAVGGGADDQTAAEVPFTPAGGLAATDVQAALEELDAEKQASDSDLTAIAALTTTAFGRGLLELANAAALLSAAGAQAADADLTAIAALSPSNDDVIQRKAGAWTNRPLAQLLTDLAALGTTFQPLDSDLTSIAALTTTSFGRGLLELANQAALLAAAGAAAASHTHSAADVTSGTLALARGGTGASLADPDADRILFWDDSAGAVTFLSLSGLAITDTTLGFSADMATQAELDAHLNDAADAHDASAISSVPAGNLAATDVQSALNELDSEKAATSHAHAGEDITSGTVADARIAATIARDSEVTAAVSASEAGQVRDGDAAGGVLGGTYPNPSFAADMATQAELDAHVNDAADAHDASAISIADVAGDFTATDVEGALAELQSDHEADATALSDHIADTADAHDASAISFTPNGSIAATDVQAAIQEVRDEAGGGGAPTDVDYLVGTASGGLSAEIVVGTSPGGELGGTWASPTVDATHSGSSHAAVQAAAEATAAAALSAHLTDTADAHDASAVSVDSTTLSGTGTDVQASLEELDNLLDDHSARHENGGADEISLAGLSGVPADVPPSTRALTAGNGLSGGGDLSADRSFAVNVDDASIEINTDTLRVKAGGITAAMVASDVATQAELDAHISDSSAAHAASAISADSTTLVGTGTDVQAVLEELDNGIADHLADSSAAHAASAIAFTPNGSIAATDVQAAIQEVRDEAGGSTTADNENLIIHMEVFA